MGRKYYYYRLHFYRLTFLPCGRRSQCSVFRPWQGWTSLSSTGPGEGTLRVIPFLNLTMAYILLRPFFRLRPSSERDDIPLGFEHWELNLDGTEYPGSELTAQVLTERTHPHLRLEKSVTSVPRVEPGDQVYCLYLRDYLKANSSS